MGEDIAHASAAIERTVASQLLAHLVEKGVALSIKDGELVIRGKAGALDASLVARLRDNKEALLSLVRAGGQGALSVVEPAVPPNLIPPGCERITPEMVTLIELSSEQIERIVATVRGGARNVQDIYPLAPLQGSILLHYLMRSEGDLYLRALLSFASREELEEFARALQAVIDRHDILRTAVHWEGLPEPVQVVWRQAPLVMMEAEIDAGSNAEDELLARFDSRRYRLDMSAAPSIRAATAYDARNGRWLLLCLMHHFAGDQTTLQQVQAEVATHLRGDVQGLPRPVPFRDFVARMRLRSSHEKHERFFRELLADVDDPTLPFGLMGDGSGDDLEAAAVIDARLTQRLHRCARKLGVTTASLIHVAFAQVLARLSGRDDVVFGSVFLGRMQGLEGSGRTLGLFINALPVRIKVGDRKAAQCARDVQALLAELVEHEHVPLSVAQRCSGIPAPAPLFGALLNYRHRAPDQP